MCTLGRSIWGVLLGAALFSGVPCLQAGSARGGGSVQNLAASINPRGEKAPDRFVPGRVLVKFRAGVSREHAEVITRGVKGRKADEIRGAGVDVVELSPGADEAAAAGALGSRPEVEFVELDRILPVEQAIPNDPLYTSPGSWALWKIKGAEAWAMNTGSSGIIIAILDTGVDGSHEDLVGKMVPGRNVYNNNSDTSDVTGHGTAVAGVAAASSNNGMGIASVAWGALLMPVRISDSYGYASYSSIANGLTWAADRGARVANVSYNVTGSSTVSSAARYFQSKGGVVASAAGNNGAAAQASDDPYILTVGATDSSDLLFSWSNSGRNLDLVAPGNVSTTMRGGGYGGGGGTSFSSPLVAGAAALVLSANPGLSPSQVQNILKQSADDLGASGWDPTYGHGRLHLERAVSMAFGGGGVDVTPPTANISSPSNSDVVSGVVSVTTSTADDVGVVKVELYVNGAFYAASTIPPYTIKWNARKATKGAHALQAKAFDAAGNVGLSPVVTVYR